MSAPPPPPYTRSFLLHYRQAYVQQQQELALNKFVSTVTASVLAAAQQGLMSYTVEEIPVANQYQEAINALKANFPDITIRLINLPSAQKRVSVPGIYIAWI